MQFFLLKHGESRLIEIKEADKEEEQDSDHNEEQVNGDVQQEEQEPEKAPEEEQQGLFDYIVDKVNEAIEEPKADEEPKAEEDQWNGQDVQIN